MTIKTKPQSQNYETSHKSWGSGDLNVGFSRFRFSAKSLVACWALLGLLYEENQDSYLPFPAYCNNLIVKKEEEKNRFWFS